MTRFDFKKMIGSRATSPDLTSLTAPTPEPQSDAQSSPSSTAASKAPQKESKRSTILSKLRSAGSQKMIRPHISSPTLLNSSLDMGRTEAWHEPLDTRKPLLAPPSTTSQCITSGTLPEAPGMSFESRPASFIMKRESRYPSQVSPLPPGTPRPLSFEPTTPTRKAPVRAEETLHGPTRSVDDTAGAPHSPPPLRARTRRVATPAGAGNASMMGPTSMSGMVSSASTSEDEEIKLFRTRLEAAERKTRELREEFEWFLFEMEGTGTNE